MTTTAIVIPFPAPVPCPPRRPEALVLAAILGLTRLYMAAVEPVWGEGEELPDGVREIWQTLLWLRASGRTPDAGGLEQVFGSRRLVALLRQGGLVGVGDLVGDLPSPLPSATVRRWAKQAVAQPRDGSSRLQVAGRCGVKPALAGTPAEMGLRTTDRRTRS